MDSIAQSNQLTLTHRPTPFPDSALVVMLDADKTLTQLLHDANILITDDDTVIIAINGRIVPSEYWSHVKPKSGCHVLVCVTPADGGGGGQKDARRTILTLVVAVLAAYTGGAALKAYGPFAGGLASAAVSVGGMMLANKIAPPALSDARSLTQGKPASLVDGARNRPQHNDSVPIVLGRMRIVPPMAAMPVTETFGNKQYLHVLLCCGYGTLILSELKIGDTLIEDYAATGAPGDVGYQIHDGQGAVPVFNVFKRDINEQSLAITLNEVDGWHERTTDVDCVEISADFLYPRGLIRYDEENNRFDATVETELQYALVGTEEWSVGRQPKAFVSRSQDLPVGEFYSYDGETGFYPSISIIGLHAGNGDIYILLYTRKIRGGEIRSTPPSKPSWFVPLAEVTRPFSTGLPTIVDLRDDRLYASLPTDFEVTAVSNGVVQIAAGSLRTNSAITFKTPDALWHAVRYKVAKGQYRVRARRITADSDSGLLYDEVQWRTLRSISDSPPVTVAGFAFIEASFKATDRLGGVVDDINCVAESFIPDWDYTSQAWVTRETNNPASLYRWIKQGPMNSNPVADEDMDLIELQDWHDNCRINGYEFNYYYQPSKGDIDELLDMIAASGRAQRDDRPGKHSIIQDKIGKKLANHFNAQNSRNLRVEKTFYALPHGLEVKFSNELNYFRVETRVVYADGYDDNNATIIEPLDLPGVTHPDLVYKHGRYHLAVLKLRPEAFSFDTDIEYLACRRGSLIRFSSTVVLVGLGDGRIKSATLDAAKENAIGVLLDAPVPMDHNGPAYAIRYRSEDGSSHVHEVHRAGGLHKTLMFKTPVPVTPPADQNHSAPSAGDLFSFGEAGKETIELIVYSIEPMSNLSARIYAVSYAPAVHDSDTGLIPDYDPQITLPVDLRLSTGSPQIDTGLIRSDETVMERGQDGSLSERIFVPFVYVSGKSFDQVTHTETRIRRSNSGDAWVTKIHIDYQQQIYFTNVNTGEDYDLEFRYRFNDGRVSDFTQYHNYTVVGDSTPPPAVDGISISRQLDGNHSISVTYSKKPIDYGHLDFTINGIAVHRNITALDFVSKAFAIKKPGNYVIGIIAYDRSLNPSAEFTVNYTRPAVPDVPNPFLVARQSDGTREFRWSYPNPPIDHAGFKVRYKLGAGPYTLGDLDIFPDVDLLPPGAHLYETNQFAEGEYTFAITAQDTSGNESVNANFIISTLGSPRIASIAAQAAAELMKWPGVLTNCFINENNVLEDVGTQNWEGVPAQFDNWTAWNNAPHGTITYEHPFLDAGGITEFVPLISVAATGTATIEFCYSDDNITYSAWQAPAGQVRGRYVKVRVTVVGGYPHLSSVRIMLSAELAEEFIDDLDTATLSATYRLAAGQIHISTTKSYSKVKHVGVVFQGFGAGWDYKVIDKDHATGPLIYLYNGSGVLSDALIDARIVGIEAQ